VVLAFSSVVLCALVMHFVSPRVETIESNTRAVTVSVFGDASSW
jgi:hypothetical protein